MPHAVHFILGHQCRFKLATYVGGFIVSTVGEYFPDADVREILAKSRGVELKGRGDDREAMYMRKIGFEEIGCGRKYETFVFRAKPAPEGDECGCAYRIADGGEIDSIGTNSAAGAYANHMELCEKWAAVDPMQFTEKS